MLYTIIPYETIYPMEDNTQFEYEEMEYQGSLLQLYKKDNKYVIRRVISTDPKVYLNNSLSPGNEFKL